MTSAKRLNTQAKPNQHIMADYGGRELPFTFFQSNYILIPFKIN